MKSVKELVENKPFPSLFEYVGGSIHMSSYWYIKDRTFYAMTPIIQDQVAKKIANNVWELCSDEISSTRSISKT